MAALILGGVMVLLGYGAWKAKKKWANLESAQEVEEEVDIAVKTHKIQQRTQIKLKQLEETNADN